MPGSACFLPRGRQEGPEGKCFVPFPPAFVNGKRSVLKDLSREESYCEKSAVQIRRPAQDREQPAKGADLAPLTSAFVTCTITYDLTCRFRMLYMRWKALDNAMNLS